MYTDDVIHDVVGSPAGPLHGPGAPRGSYEMLTQNIKTEQMEVRHARYGPDFCVIEHQRSGTVHPIGLVPGLGKLALLRHVVLIFLQSR